MNNIPNRKAICDVLLKEAKTDSSLVVLCSDSRGSASMTPFFEQYKEQSIEVGIAEQNLVSIAAGLAKCGKKSFVFSPACFLTTRSYEQVKIDVCYSNTNVKLIGISGGISYGELGMSHHSLQDIADMSALPNMRVYLPSDRFQTKRLLEELLKDNLPAYLRVGRNPVEDIYQEQDCTFKLNQCNVFGNGEDLLIVSCGELVIEAIKALDLLKEHHINATVLDMYCLKPLDESTLLQYAKKSKVVLTIEEAAPYGGLYSMVCQTLSKYHPIRVLQMCLPDSKIITGKSKDVFDYYGLNKEGIVKKAMEALDE